MKIAYIYRDFWGQGGVPTDMRAIANAQAALGNSVAAISMKRAGLERNGSVESSIQAHEIPSGAAGRNELAGILAAFKPDIVHFMGLLIAVHNSWHPAVLRLNLPTVISTNGLVNPNNMNFRWGAKKNSVLHRWRKQLYRRFVERSFILNSAAIHALSALEAECLAAYGVKRIFTAPIGLDEDAIERELPPRRLSLQKPVRFLFLGRLEIVQKGLDLMLESFAAVSREKSAGDFELIIAGPSVNGSREWLEARAGALGLKNVRFTGAVSGDAKRDLWFNADFFMHPSRFEGMSRAAREAAGMGMPLIASRESNFGDWAESEKMGCVVDLNPARMADVLTGIIEGERREDYPRLCQNALAFARRYTWRGVAEAFNRGYDAALANAPRG